MDDNPSYDWETIFKSKPTPAPMPSFDYESALLNLIVPLMEQIDDYPTLTCLSMTCHTFRTYIQHPSRAQIITTSFRHLEQAIAPGSSYEDLALDENAITTCWRGSCDPFSTLGGLQRHAAPLLTITIQQGPKGEYICDHDILRANHRQLSSLAWYPCYGCSRIKRAQTDFFHDQTRDHFSLLGCRALARRCVDCNIWEPFRFDHRLRYLQDMPKGLAGYRLRCRLCRTVQWSLTRPKKKQIRMKLCAACFALPSPELSLEDQFLNEWLMFLAMSVGLSDTQLLQLQQQQGQERDEVPKGEELDVVAIVDEDTDVLDVHSLAVELKSWTPFEVLSIEAG